MRQQRSQCPSSTEPVDEPMRRFFYDIRRGTDVIRDPDGELQSSIDDAMAEAVSAAKDLVIDAMHGLRAIDDDAVMIRDSDGAIVGNMPLVDVLPIRRHAQPRLKPER